jgi:hypothetical protein
MPELDSRAHDGLIARRGVQIGDKRTVNLQLIDRQ